MATRLLCKSQQLSYLIVNLLLFIPTLNKVASRHSSFCDVLCKVFDQEPACAPLSEIQRYPIWGTSWIHSGQFLKTVEQVVENPGQSGSITDADGAGDVKKKRKKLKGKRAVVRWLKFFRWKKKKEYERMTAEEKILFKLRKVNGSDGQFCRKRACSQFCCYVP